MRYKNIQTGATVSYSRAIELLSDVVDCPQEHLEKQIADGEVVVESAEQLAWEFQTQLLGLLAVHDEFVSEISRMPNEQQELHLQALANQQEIVKAVLKVKRSQFKKGEA